MPVVPVFVKAAKRRGFCLWSGVPCSYLRPFINYGTAPEHMTELNRIIVANDSSSEEGDARELFRKDELSYIRMPAACRTCWGPRVSTFGRGRWTGAAVDSFLMLVEGKYELVSSGSQLALRKSAA